MVRVFILVLVSNLCVGCWEGYRGVGGEGGAGGWVEVEVEVGRAVGSVAGCGAR